MALFLPGLLFLKIVNPPRLDPPLWLALSLGSSIALSILLVIAVNQVGISPTSLRLGWLTLILLLELGNLLRHNQLRLPSFWQLAGIPGLMVGVGGLLFLLLGRPTLSPTAFYLLSPEGTLAALKPHHGSLDLILGVFNGEPRAERFEVRSSAGWAATSPLIPSRGTWRIPLRLQLPPSLTEVRFELYLPGHTQPLRDLRLRWAVSPRLRNKLGLQGGPARS